LVFEVTRSRGAFGAVVTFNRQGVLHFAGDAVFGGHVFGGHTHVNGVEGVVQRADHHVHHFDVTHAGTPARGQAGVGATAHVFGTTTNGDIAVAQQNRLAGADDGLQTRTAQTVNVESRRSFAAAPVDGGHP